MNHTSLTPNKETAYTGFVANGFIALVVLFLLIPAIIFTLVYQAQESMTTPVMIICIMLMIALLIGSKGFFIQQPNQARVMIFFGNYRGTYKRSGFFWTNPFMTIMKISLRIRNMDIQPIKVNDKIGNPVMIGMVLVWKINDTYRATFDIDSESLADGKTGYSTAIQEFVSIQSDAALREVTGQFAYDEEDNSTNATTLRGGGDEINELLEQKINERLSMAGIEVVEARLNYLAYAPEIAAVMLRRQQASAIISAREKIVEGAVSMVKMALDQLSKE
ncbi:MAG: SPFH domain-containing protein, partial [Paramuribaculum sp.]|nr:SPFH domain-containing protein [Paramuribaculum sp.]